MPSDMGGTIGSPKGAIGSEPGSDPSGAMGIGPTAPGARGAPAAAPAFGVAGVAAPGAVARSTGGFIRDRFQED